MLFLMDIAVPRISDGNVSDVNVDVDEESVEPDEIDDIDHTSTSSYNISSPPSTSFTTQTKNKRTKKQDTSRNFEQKLMDLETRKLAILIEPTAAPDDEDTYKFF
jgi:hypothetical protein